jgi:hypothetical protein
MGLWTTMLFSKLLSIINILIVIYLAFRDYGACDTSLLFLLASFASKHKFLIREARSN